MKKPVGRRSTLRTTAGVVVLGLGLLWGWTNVQQLAAPWPTIGHVAIVAVLLAAAVIAIVVLVERASGQTFAARNAARRERVAAKKRERS